MRAIIVLGIYRTGGWSKVCRGGVAITGHEIEESRENAKSEQHSGVTSSLFELYRTRVDQINHAGKYLLTANELS